jgi:hypothetical protein
MLLDDIWGDLTVNVICIALISALVFFQQEYIVRITAEVSAECDLSPDDSHFKFGGGRYNAGPIKNRGSGVCVLDDAVFEPPEIADSLNVVFPSILLPGDYSDLKVYINDAFVGPLDVSLRIPTHTGRLFSVDFESPTSGVEVRTTIPEGSIVRAWGRDHYVAADHSIEYVFHNRPAPNIPKPIFEHWEIETGSGVTASADNPITITAGLEDVKVRPIYTMP